MRRKILLYAFFAFLLIAGIVVALTTPYWMVAWTVGVGVGFIGCYGIHCLNKNITLDEIIKELYGEE